MYSTYELLVSAIQNSCVTPATENDAPEPTLDNKPHCRISSDPPIIALWPSPCSPWPLWPSRGTSFGGPWASRATEWGAKEIRQPERSFRHSAEKTPKFCCAKINIMSELVPEDLRALASSPSLLVPATNRSSPIPGGRVAPQPCKCTLLFFKKSLPATTFV